MDGGFKMGAGYQAAVFKRQQSSMQGDVANLPAGEPAPQRDFSQQLRCDGVTVISAVCAAPDPARAARRFVDAIDTARRARAAS